MATQYTLGVQDSAATAAHFNRQLSCTTDVIYNTAAYTNLAAKASSTLTLTKGSPPATTEVTRGLIYVYSGNANVIPRRFSYGAASITNEGTSAVSATVSVGYIRLRQPASAEDGYSRVTAGTSGLNANQVKGVYLNVKKTQYTGSFSNLAPNGTITISLSKASGETDWADGTAEHKGFFLLGIRSFSTEKWTPAYLINGIAKTMSIRNIHTSNTYSGTCKLTLVYGRLELNTSTEQRSGPAAGTIIDESHLNNIDLSLNGRKTVYFNISSITNKGNVTVNSPSLTSIADAYNSYSDPGVLQGVNSGMNRLYVYDVNARDNSMTIVNNTGSAQSASSTPSAPTPTTGEDQDEADTAIANPRIYKMLCNLNSVIS